MPATKFICPSGDEVTIVECLKHCKMSTRCMFLPTLRAVADSLHRNIKEPTVTELLAGTRETYLKKTTDYAVRPEDQLYAIHGTAFHAINEEHTDGNMLSEERLKDEITSGKFDLYGEIMDGEDKTLGDYKVTSSYRLMKALGIYKKDVLTGDFYKTGAKKGQPKTRKEFFFDGARLLLDWAIQLNYYRLLLEEQGMAVKKMVIQALCRDYSLRMANERGITKPVYLLPINRISDRWVLRYMAEKAKRLKLALHMKEMPKLCSKKERWNDRKCTGYCDVAWNCPYGRSLLEENRKAV